MTVHAHALVPIGTPADVGLFAEALVYYDRVAVQAGSPEALAALIGWFLNPGEVETFLIYVRDGVIDFVDAEPATFRQRFLEHPVVANLMQGQWRHSRFLSYSAARIIESASGNEPGEGETVRLVRTAIRYSFDLVLPEPSAQEAVALLAGRERLEHVRETVPFPDVRRSVSEGRLGLREVQDLRRAARPLRAWLQSEPPREVSAFLALHRAVGRATPWRGERMLALDGALSSGAEYPFILGA